MANLEKLQCASDEALPVLKEVVSAGSFIDAGYDFALLAESILDEVQGELDVRLETMVGEQVRPTVQAILDEYRFQVKRRLLERVVQRRPERLEHGAMGGTGD